MTCGVKFCGGCQPVFDRKSFLEHVKAACTELDFVYCSQEQEPPEIILVICGCSASCVNDNFLSDKRTSLYVTKKEDLCWVVKALKEITQDNVGEENYGI